MNCLPLDPWGNFCWSKHSCFSRGGKVCVSHSCIKWIWFLIIIRRRARFPLECHKESSGILVTMTRYFRKKQPWRWMNRVDHDLILLLVLVVVVLVVRNGRVKMWPRDCKIIWFVLKCFLRRLFIRLSFLMSNILLKRSKHELERWIKRQVNIGTNDWDDEIGITITTT